MKNFNILLRIVLSMVFLGLIGWGIYWGVRSISRMYQQFTPMWAAGMTIGSLVLILCTLILAYAINRAANKRFKPIPPEKASAYQLFIEMWLSRNRKPAREKQRKLDQMLALWANDSVLKAYIAFQELASDPESSWDDIHDMAGEVVLAMRADLGFSTITITSDDLTELHVSRSLPED